MAADDLVTYACDGKVATLGLNRPDKRNAINDAVIDALHAAVERAHEEADVAVLHGHGSNFCAGLDLAEALARATGQIARPAKRKRHNWHEVFDLIARGPIPFVGALHGAHGAGSVHRSRLPAVQRTGHFPRGVEWVFVKRLKAGEQHVHRASLDEWG